MVANLASHYQDCRGILGFIAKQVHEFLDQYAEIFPPQIFGEYHRTFLHNRRGIELCKTRWNADCAKVAKVHIVRDWCEDPNMWQKDMDWVEKNLGKALMYLNNMDNFDPRLDPGIVGAWGGRSLCAIAFEDSGYDQYYRHIREY